MPAVQPRPESVVTTVSALSPDASPEGIHPSPPASPAARLADELAVPAPSPVHQLQAELVQLTAPAEADAIQLYPGWFRLAFPLASSLVLWAMILWGASRVF